MCHLLAPATLAASNYVRDLDRNSATYMPVYDTSDAAFLQGLFDYANATKGRVTRLLVGAVPGPRLTQCPHSRTLRCAPVSLVSAHPSR